MRLLPLCVLLVACGSSTAGSGGSSQDSSASGAHDGGSSSDSSSSRDGGRTEAGPPADASHGSGAGDGGLVTGSGDGGAMGTGSGSHDGGATGSGSGDGGTSMTKDSGGHESDASSADATSNAMHADAADGDGGWALGCSGTLQMGPTVPAAGYLFFAQGTKSYALVGDDESWIVVDRNASTATTSPIPFPAGVSSMSVLEVGRAYDGSELILFGAASTPFATFWDGTAFSTPVALPTDAVSIRADGERHLFAVDSSHVLWDGRSGTFVNRGAIPFQNAIPFVGSIQEGYWQWSVAPSGVVTVVYAGQTPVGVLSQQYGASFSWSSIVTVYTRYASTDSFGDIQISGGLDGSVHTLYVDTYAIGTGGGTGTVAGYSRTHGTDPWDTHSLPYLASGVDVEASSYGDVQALFASATADGSGGFTLGFEWATPACTGTTIDWWTTIPIQSNAIAQTGAPRMGVGEGGYPSFYLADEPTTEIVTTF